MHSNWGYYISLYADHLEVQELELIWEGISPW